MVVQPAGVGKGVSSASGTPTCAPFINTTLWNGDDGDSASSTSRRYGVRSVRQRPGSDDARCESTR